MSITNEIRPRLLGTLLNVFKINTIQLKNNNDSLALRNDSDTAYIDVEVNQLRVYGDNATNPIILNAPNALTDSLILTLPDRDGYSGQMLQTDGAGQLSFADVNANTYQSSAQSNFDKHVEELLRTNG